MSEKTFDQVKRALLSMQRHSWEQGVAMQAFLEIGDQETVHAMAFEAVNRITGDGRPATIGEMDAITDPCSVGEALLRACEETGDPFLCEGRDRLLDWTMKRAPRNAQGLVYHLTRTREFWVDSMYMLPPYLAAAGQCREAFRQWKGYWEVLYDQEQGLMSHMWDDAAQNFSRKAHWGSGNGWTLASAPRMVALLREQGYDREAQEIAQKAKQLLDVLLLYLREDGLFHDIVDEEASFVETNLSQMTAYAIYRGISQGWLEEKYRSYADRMREAANRKVNRFGFVEGACGAPAFDRPGVSPEAQAFYLMMEHAAEQCVRRE